MSNLRGSIFIEQGEVSRFKNKKTLFFQSQILVTMIGIPNFACYQSLKYLLRYKENSSTGSQRTNKETKEVQ